MNTLAFSPDGKYLLTSTYDIGSGGTVELRLFDATGGYRQLAVGTLDANRYAAAVMAPNGKWVMLTDQGGRAWVCSMPDLKPIKQVIAEGGGRIGSKSAAVSPDGRWLAIGSPRDLVRVFDTATWQPIRPGGGGHAGEVTGVYFTAADGKSLRTVGRDDTVCLWNAATMKLLRRTPLPDGHVVGAVRLLDGRIILCPDMQAYERSVSNECGSPVVKVFDAEAGRVIAQMDLPIHWQYAATKVIWLDDHQAVWLDERRWRRFDFRSGKPIDERPFDGGPDDATEDGKALLDIGGGGKGNLDALRDRRRHRQGDRGRRRRAAPDHRQPPRARCPAGGISTSAIPASTCTTAGCCAGPGEGVPRA